MAAHALLSPSAAHRWLHCTAAPRLEEHVEDRGSAFAEEGTLAHAYCAMHLKTYLGLPVDEEVKEITSLAPTYHTGEMDEYTDTYKTIVLEKYGAARAKTPDAQLLVEQRLDFTEYIPEAFGTADAVIIADGEMEVIDFKYGKGVRVSAKRNPQMMIYALGAYEKYSMEYDIREVKLTIVQPRIDNISEDWISAAELTSWGMFQLRPKAKEAFSGGRQEPGEWCRFCKVKANCKALANETFTLVNKHSDPKTVSAERMAADVLPMLDLVKTWVKAVEEYTLQEALNGRKFPGYKLVAGRSVRKITDPQSVINTLQEYFSPESYMKPQELKTITDLEKTIGKKRFNELCGDYIDKPIGKPTLVPDSDKRQELDTDAFTGVNLTE